MLTTIYEAGMYQMMSVLNMIVSMNQLKQLPWGHHGEVLIVIVIILNKSISIAQASSYFKCFSIGTFT